MILRNKKEISKNGENEDSKINEDEMSSVIKNNNAKNLDDVKNLDKISSLEIIDSGIEHIDKLKGKRKY